MALVHAIRYGLSKVASWAKRGKPATKPASRNPSSPAKKQKSTASQKQKMENKKALEKARKESDKALTPKEKELAKSKGIDVKFSPTSASSGGNTNSSNGNYSPRVGKDPTTPGQGKGKGRSR